MIIPGRNCVARISFAPDAYGILRQAIPNYFISIVFVGHSFNRDIQKRVGFRPPETPLCECQKKIIDAETGPGQRKCADFARESGRASVPLVPMQEGPAGFRDREK
jgi:hypothetical protein